VAIGIIQNSTLVNGEQISHKGENNDGANFYKIDKCFGYLVSSYDVLVDREETPMRRCQKISITPGLAVFDQP
jgi:hypothetical protein